MQPRDALIVCCGGAVAVHIVCVLLGAPFMDGFLHTAAAALLASCVLCVPVAWGMERTGHGRLWNAEVYHRVLCTRGWETRRERAVAVYSYTLTAALWASAAVVPLDWDVWYQRWPIPFVAATVGAAPVAAGLAVGSLWCTPPAAASIKEAKRA